MESKVKKCNKCLEEKTLDNFCKDISSKDLLSYRCKKCNQIYKSNPNQKIRAKKLFEEWKIKNEEINKIKRKQYREKNRKKRTIYNKMKFQRDKEKIYLYNKKHRNLPKNKLGEILRGQIYSSLSKSKTYKNNKSIKYLGCSLQEFKQHLESQFKPEMNWNNHGKIWEIDHVIPLSSFDFTIEENLYKAFHYFNTQPLFKTTEIAESFGYKNYVGNRNKQNKIVY